MDGGGEKALFVQHATTLGMGAEGIAEEAKCAVSGEALPAACEVTRKSIGDGVDSLSLQDTLLNERGVDGECRWCGCAAVADVMKDVE